MVVSSAVLCPDNVSMGTAVYMARLRQRSIRVHPIRQRKISLHYESTCKWENTLQLSIIPKTATSGIPSQTNDHLQNCHALQSFSELCENCKVSSHQFLTSEITDRKLRLGNQCGSCRTNNICTCKHHNIQPISSPVCLCDDSLCQVRFSICQFNPSKFDVTRPFQFSQNSENLCSYLTRIILSFLQHQDKPVFDISIAKDGKMHGSKAS